MYDVLQLTVKAILIGATCLVAAIVSVRLWYTDLDLRTLFNPLRLVRRAADAQVGLFPAREPGGLYQDGNLVARVGGEPRIDEKTQTVYFAEVYEAKALDPQQQLEFRRWRLRWVSYGTRVDLDSAAPEKGRTYSDVVCKILGTRTL